jgi:hypothetical protein
MSKERVLASRLKKVGPTSAIVMVGAVMDIVPEFPVVAVVEVSIPERVKDMLDVPASVTSPALPPEVMNDG